VKLTIEAWRGLVADHLRRAWESQWNEATDRECDYCGERLVEDGWSVTRATWAVKQVVRVSYSPKGIMAALDRVDRGDKDRDGNITGGWLQSKPYHDENRETVYAKSRAECYAQCRDFPDYEPGCQRGKVYCGRCPGVQRRTGSQTGGGFKPLSELLPQPEAQNGIA
jgi:hypothetical protein